MVFYYSFLTLMFAGNTFGSYQFLTGNEAFLQKFPAVTENNFILFQRLPVLNIIGLSGLLFFYRWPPWVAVPGVIAVIAADIYFGIRCHLYRFIPSTLILFFLFINF